VTYIQQQSSEETIISRWWEAKARVELSSSIDTKEIVLIYSFVPFQDPGIPSRLLATRENCTLEKVLMSLGDRRKIKNERKGEQYQSDTEIRSLRLAEEVARFLNARHTSSSPKSALNWKWEAPDDRTTAKVISSRISSAFCTVIFSDWVRIALGYEAESFSRLATWISSARNIYRQCLNEKPHLRLHYELLEKVRSLGTISEKQNTKLSRSYVQCIHWLIGCLQLA
jgi:hypothetical protein